MSQNVNFFLLSGVIGSERYMEDFQNFEGNIFLCSVFSVVEKVPFPSSVSSSLPIFSSSYLKFHDVCRLFNLFYNAVQCEHWFEHWMWDLSWSLERYSFSISSALTWDFQTGLLLILPNCILDQLEHSSIFVLFSPLFCLSLSVVVIFCEIISHLF